LGSRIRACFTGSAAHHACREGWLRRMVLEKGHEYGTPHDRIEKKAAAAVAGEVFVLELRG
jgi:hypothetical protein